MTEQRTIFERMSNAIFGIPTVAQFWARQTANRTAAYVDPNAPIPFTPASKPLSVSRVALITTGGVHLRSQLPFDMTNPLGDPSFRAIPTESAAHEMVITHKYYDHSDADRDLNVIFPLSHLRDLATQGIIGSLARHHYGFMGHIDGAKVDTLIRDTACEVTLSLHADKVDYVLLAPA